MLGPSWKRNFSPRLIRPFHDRPVTFIVSQWQHDKSSANLKYCLYRLTIFLLYFVPWIMTFVREPVPDGIARWPIYLTNWGFTLGMFQSMLCCIMVTVSFIAESSNNITKWQEKILKLYPVYWILNIIATPVAFTISIIYWTLIFRAEGAAFTTMNFMVHGMNSILVFLDLCVVSHPVRILHLIYPLILSLCYTIFTVIFYVSGGTTKTGSRYIYPILKWDKPGVTTGVCVGVMFVMIFLHIACFAVYKLREKMYGVIFLPKIPPPSVEAAYDNKAMATDYV